MDNNIIIHCKKGQNIEIMNAEQSDIYQTGKITLALLGKCFDKNYKRLFSKDFYDLILNNDNEFPDITNFNGIFSVIYIDEGNKIHFYNDKTNISRLYYCITDDAFYLSSSVDKIVKNIDIMLNIDFTAWSEYICFYYVLGNKTFFEEIKSLFFREKLCFDLTDWSLHSHIDNDLSKIKTDTSLNYDDTVNKCAALIQESINNIFENTKGVSKVITLSGGWDSRVIAAAAANIDKDEIETVTTYIDSGHDKEERYAKLVADYLGIQNTCIDLDKDYFLKELCGNYLIDTDYFSTMHIPFWNFYKKYPLNNRIILDGIYGDLFFRGMALSKIKAKPESEEYFDECFSALKLSKLEKYMPPAIKTGAPYLAKKAMVEQLKHCNYNLKLFIMANRSKNIGLTGYKQNENNIVFFPFAGEDLIRFALTIPDEFIFNENFYPDIMEKVCEGISHIPSTNTKKVDKDSFNLKDVYRLSDTVREFFKDKLGKHFSEVNGFYDPILLRRLLEWNKENITLKNYRDLDLLLFYQLWLDNYNNKILHKNAVIYIENHTDTKDIERNNDLTIIFNNDTRQQEIKKWLDFYKANKSFDNKLMFLCTMDVEAFVPEDLRSVHTAKGDYINKLICGYCDDETGYILDKIVGMNEVPFTFFTEIYSDAYPNNNLYKDILKLCASNGNEAGLHCHSFSIGKNIINELGIDFWEHTTKSGFEKIIQYGVDKYKKALGKIPVSYRAGSFEVYDGHFEALAKAGIRVDSSLYCDSIYNFSKTGNHNKNFANYFDGVYEIPLTTYNKNNAIYKFDLNFTSFSNKLELITRSLLNQSDYLMMICHSWSFLKYDKYGSTSNLYHTDFSKNTYDEFMYMVDFIHQTEDVTFSTCKQFLEKNEVKHSLIDVIENPIDIPVYILPPKYGKLRTKTDVSNFIDLSDGRLIDNEGNEYFNDDSDSFELKFNLAKVPKQFDTAEYVLDIPCMDDNEVKLEFILEKKYYNPRLYGRNRIKLNVFVNNQLKFYDFITNPSFNEYMYIFAKPVNNNIHFKVQLECLKDEEPWGWPNASRTIVKYLYLEQKDDVNENRFILLNNTSDIMHSLNENIRVEDMSDGFKIMYKKENENNNYLQLFDNRFMVGPSEKYAEYCKIPNKKSVVINFSASSLQEKSIAYLFFMTYDDFQGNRISNLSEKLIINTDKSYFSKKFDIHDMSKVFKIAIKLAEGEATNEIIIQDLEFVFYD